MKSAMPVHLGLVSLIVMLAICAVPSLAGDLFVDQKDPRPVTETPAPRTSR